MVPLQPRREAEKWVETKHGRRTSWVKRRSLGSIL